METGTSGRAAATVASVVTLAGGGIAIENALGDGASSARTAPPSASATPGGGPASAAAGGSSAAAATSGGSAGAGAPAAATVKFAATRVRQAATGTA
ncbi:MAG: hypothetical protein QOJ21_457, partial [Solirubrobacteraceae bacterium]|nr:hypothetical protein [Solirubrobacteraceae bacterium]